MQLEVAPTLPPPLEFSRGTPLKAAREAQMQLLHGQGQRGDRMLVTPLIAAAAAALSRMILDLFHPYMLKIMILDLFLTQHFRSIHCWKILIGAVHSCDHIPTLYEPYKQVCTMRLQSLRQPRWYSPYGHTGC